MRARSNFVFFGTPRFAEIVLDKLVEAGFLPSVVICNPDRPVGRKKIVTPPPVKQRIMNYDLKIRNKIKIWQPEKLTAEGFRRESGEVDFGVVAAYAQIIKKEILDIPKLGVIGVHPSLLPKFRGASPIQSAILEGEDVTGVTLYLMDEKMDHGPILASRELKIPGNEYYGRLLKKLAELGGDLLIEIIPKFVAGKIIHQEQNHELKTLTRKFETRDGFVEIEDLKAALDGDKEKAVKIDRMIRALNPEPGPWTVIRGKRVKLLESEVKGGRLALMKIQREGKNPTERVDLF